MSRRLVDNTVNSQTGEVVTNIVFDRVSRRLVDNKMNSQTGEVFTKSVFSR
jgi:hypothetical protein